MDEQQAALRRESMRTHQATSNHLDTGGSVSRSYIARLVRTKHKDTNDIAEATTVIDEPVRSPWLLMLGIQVISFALVVARRPDALTNPQFWAEDFLIFYGQAYALGPLRAIFIPYGGYFLFLPRIVTACFMGLPLSTVPLAFNLAGIVIQTLPVVFLFSGRFDHLIPSLRVRLLLGVLYLALPNSNEVNVTLTNSQWHLAVLLFMVVIAPPSSQRVWRFFDTVVIIAGGLTGPFCVLLLPVAAIRWYLTRSGRSVTNLALLFATSVIQSLPLVLHIPLGPEYLPPQPVESALTLGDSVMLVVRIVAGQIYLGTTLGMSTFVHVSAARWWAGYVVPVVIFVGGTAFVAFACLRGPIELRLLVLFAGLTTLATLDRVYAQAGLASWEALVAPAAGVRYWYFGILTLVVCTVWAVSQNTHLIARASGVLLLGLILAVGVRSDWSFPTYADNHFATYASKFEHLPYGAALTFPINPGWQVTLTKQHTAAILPTLACTPTRMCERKWANSIPAVEGGPGGIAAGWALFGASLPFSEAGEHE